jgi:TolB protein
MISPDGTRLLFDRFGHDRPANHDLFVRDLHDGALRQLTRDTAYDSDARWSPNGQLIVWHSDRGAATRYHTQIFTSRDDGSNVRQLTRGAARAGYPVWSPNGRHIAYTMELDGNRDVWIMQADGSNPRPVTTYSGFDGDPAWSPTGDRLIITTGRYGGQELAVLDLTALRMN